VPKEVNLIFLIKNAKIFISRLLRLDRPNNLNWINFLALRENYENLATKIVTEELYLRFQLYTYGFPTQHLIFGHYWPARLSFVGNKLILNAKSGLYFKNLNVLSGFGPRNGSAQDAAVLFRAKRTSTKNFNNSDPAYFINNMGGNFYHWMIEELPRILFVKENYSEVHYLSLNNLPEFAKEILNLLKIDLEIITSETIQIERSIHIETNKVGFPHPSDINRIRKFLESLNVSKDFSFSPEYIYVSRSRSSRSLHNEKELEEYLRNREFKICYSEEMSIREKVTTFSNCSLLIAPFGAGLTNLIFTPENCHVLELSTSQNWGTYYPALAYLFDRSLTTIPLALDGTFPDGVSDQAIAILSDFLNAYLSEGK